MRNKELDELLEKLDSIRSVTPLTNDDIDLIVERIKEEPKKARQTGPAIGQQYWIHRLWTVSPHEYNADGFDINVDKYNDLYPEERFAEAELRAMQLIVSVNKRRRELNEGKEFEDRQYYIEYWDIPGSVNWESTRSKYARGVTYPFGLFKNSVDCETCMHEFEDELEWFSEEYLPLMAELAGLS